MAKLTSNCPICSKPLVQVGFSTIGAEILTNYKCGHSFIATKEEKKPLKLTSVYGDKKARGYQVAGVDFMVNGAEGNESGFNCIIGDQMRLGKTPQALLALASDMDNRTPCLIIVRAANIYQWLQEFKEWTTPLPLGIYVINNTKGFIPQGFSAYIVSMDTFSRGDLSDRLLTFGFKLCIVDEAHSFKNVESKRSQALIAFLKNINKADITHEVEFNCPLCRFHWVESITIQIDGASDMQRTSRTTHCERCSAVVGQSAAAHVKVSRKCGVIMLTGTAIKNRADEYFVPLNIVAPAVFPSLDQFRRQWLTQDMKSKWSRVHPYKVDSFKQMIAPFVLRREKEDVYTDLPPINRMFTVIEVEDERLKKAYNQVLDKLELEMAENPNLSFAQSIAELTMLRQIAGLAKVPWVADYIETMLMDSDKQKIAIGIHHHGVRDALKRECAQFGCMKLDGQDSAEQKYWIMKNFEHAAEHVLIVNELAGGVGMDFHYIDNIVCVERQWNGADESQFEFRFYNPDKSIKNRPTNIEYVLAKGTLDQWWHDMLVEKYGNLGSTIGTNWDVTSDPKSFRQLLEVTVANRL